MPWRQVLHHLVWLSRDLFAPNTYGCQNAEMPYKSPLYPTWQNMIRRCYKQDSVSYKHYGARGITVCERWHKFKAFLEDMGDKPSPEHQLNRIDNDGPYSPENCEWTTRKQNNRNTRHNLMLTINGKTQCFSAWCEENNVSLSLARDRYYNYGWKAVDAVTEPRRSVGRPGQTRHILWLASNGVDIE